MTRFGASRRDGHPIRLHKVDARDEIGIIPVNRNILARALALEARHLRPLNQHCLNREFLPQFSFPLIAKMGGESTARRLAMPRSSSSRAIIPASIALPTPTSSSHGIEPQAMISGANWYGRGVTDIRPK
jgi:hypothetical protein